MSNDEKILVRMFGTVLQDGGERRRRWVNGPMNAEKIIGANNLQDAIDYFLAQIGYIESVAEFEYFMIGGNKYESTFWKP